MKVFFPLYQTSCGTPAEMPGILFCPKTEAASQKTSGFFDMLPLILWVFGLVC